MQKTFTNGIFVVIIFIIRANLNRSKSCCMEMKRQTPKGEERKYKINAELFFNPSDSSKTYYQLTIPTNKHGVNAGIATFKIS